VRRFLDETKPLKRSERKHSISEFVSRFEEFRPPFRQFLSDRRSRDKREAPEFNVFELLRVERNEAAHSRFLANLLDPAGTHGQGAFFLNHFLLLPKAGSPISYIAGPGHTRRCARVRQA
jgi:hypothetical protein